MLFKTLTHKNNEVAVSIEMRCKAVFWIADGNYANTMRILQQMEEELSYIVYQ